MDRKDVLNSPEYWTSKTQIELYNQAQKFMEATGKDRAHLAEYLGVSKGYVSQLLNGDYDHRMSKFFELALAFGVIPQIDANSTSKCKITKCFCKSTPLVLRNSISFLVSH